MLEEELKLKEGKENRATQPKGSHPVARGSIIDEIARFNAHLLPVDQQLITSVEILQVDVYE